MAVLRLFWRRKQTDEFEVQVQLEDVAGASFAAEVFLRDALALVRAEGGEGEVRADDGTVLFRARRLPRTRGASDPRDTPA